jgi:hypothetical protein
VLLKRALLAGTAWATLAFGAVAIAAPFERVSTEADQRRVNVTIDNGGTALIHDRRRISFTRGRNRLAWRERVARSGSVGARMTWGSSRPTRNTRTSAVS